MASPGQCLCVVNNLLVCSLVGHLKLETGTLGPPKLHLKNLLNVNVNESFGPIYNLKRREVIPVI